MLLPREIGDSILNSSQIKSSVNIWNQTLSYILKLTTMKTHRLHCFKAFKAYLRGHIISFQSSLKKRNKAKQLELEEEIRQLDMENALHPSLEKHTKISTLKFKLNKILSDRICRTFIFTKQRYFEFGQ